jgi:hypothetical protein
LSLALITARVSQLENRVRLLLEVAATEPLGSKSIAPDSHRPVGQYLAEADRAAIAVRVEFIDEPLRPCPKLGGTVRKESQMRCIERNEAGEAFTPYNFNQPFAMSIGGRPANGQSQDLTPQLATV